MNQPERWPDRVVSTQDKSISCAAQNCLHSTPVSLDTSCAFIIKIAAVNRSPKVRVKFEIGATPFTSHSAEQVFEMLLHLRMSSVQHIPWPTPPPAKSHRV